MESWQDEIIKAQISQEIGVEKSLENSDISIFLKSFKENLIGAVDRDSFDKSWSSDLQSKFPSGSWKTVNGASVFINNGKVVAGLDGFNGEIDKFFEQKGKKTEIGDKKESGGKNATIKELSNQLNESHKTGKELSGDFYSKFTKLSKEDQSKVIESTDSHEVLKEKREALEKILRSGSDKQKTTDKEVKEKSEGGITLDTFMDIAKKAKDVKDFMRKVVAIKGVPSSVANEFQNKYGDGGKLTMEQASQNFMDAAKGKEKEVVRESQKPEETKQEKPKARRESKSSKANKRMHSLEGYKSSKTDADNSDSYEELNKITKELDPKLMSSKDKESEAKLIEEIQENFWSPDDSDRSKKLSDVVWSSNSIKESMDAINKLQRIASKTDYSVLDDKTMNKVKGGVATMLQNQINKKETERLNYKLF